MNVVNNTLTIVLISITFAVGVSCSSVPQQEWGHGAASRCDSGRMYTVKIERSSRHGAGSKVDLIDIIVHGACGPQLFSSVDTSFSFHIPVADSTVIMDFRIDGVVLDGWEWHTNSFGYVWEFRREERPFSSLGPDEEVPCGAKAMYAVAFDHFGRSRFK